MTALLLDIGNTRVKWGVLRDGEIRRTGHIAQARIRENGLQVITTRLPRRVDAVFASNVAGASFATRLSGVVGAHSNCDVRFAHTERQGWGVTNAYTQPRRMGVDRWVAMVGAASILPRPVGARLSAGAGSAGGAVLGSSPEVSSWSAAAGID